MPLIQIFTSAASPSPAAQETLLGDLSRLLAETFHKPEQWVMTCLIPGLAMTFGGKRAPACFAVVKNIGDMTPDTTAALSRQLCACLSEALNVDTDRIYIQFAPAVGHLWGWNNETFG